MIFNWKQNSINILKNHEYSHADRWEKKRLYRQQIELCAYLHSLGKTEQEIEKIWEDIPCPGDLFDNYERHNYFHGIYLKSINKKMTTSWSKDYDKPKYIYQEEIDAINSIDNSYEFRKYLLMLLGIYKFHISVNGSCYFDASLRGYAWETANVGKKYGHYGEDLISHNIKSGKPIQAKIIGGKKSHTLSFARNKGNVVLEFKDPVEVTKILDQIEQPYRFCEKCGTKYFINNKTKTNLCPECLKKVNNEKAKKRMSILYHKISSGENRHSIMEKDSN